MIRECSHTTKWMRNVDTCNLSRRLAACVLFVCALSPTPSTAQSVSGNPNAGALSRTLEDDVLQFGRSLEEQKRRKSVEERQEQQAPTEEKEQRQKTSGTQPSAKQVVPIWSSENPMPDEELLGAPIEKIFVSSPQMVREVEGLSERAFYKKNRITQQEIASLRRSIWDLFLQKGRLAYVTVRVMPQHAQNAPSAMVIKVDEISARQILIDGPKGTPLSEEARESLKTEIKSAYAKGDIINLADMDARIQHRLRLGDYALRLALVPVTPTQMDVKVIVTEHETPDAQYFLRYDNSGMRSFGRDRLLGSVSAQQIAAVGDSINFLALKTGDIGHLDGQNGVVFGRLEYEAPVSSWGVRLLGWTSAMHYDAIKDVTSDSEAQGESYEFGGAVLKPLATSKESVWDGRVDWLMKFQFDRFDSQTDLATKAAYEMRTQISHERKIAQDERVQADAALMFGVFDLTGNRSNFEQDKDGAEAHGPFAKMVGNLRWSKGSGEADSFDFATTMKAQAAVSNLDSMEKISLGGEAGLRGFGSGEAMGDHGLIVQAETGYLVERWLRLGLFYDAGWVQRYVNSFGDDGVPLSYVLQDAGASIEAAYEGVQIKTTFAHQIGRNPGLTSTGTDSDNVSRAYRIWTSLSMRF